MSTNDELERGQLDQRQMVASLAAMILVACADGNVSDRELDKLKDIVRRSTPWAGGMDSDQVERLVHAAEKRTRPIFRLATDEQMREKALAALGAEIGDVARREHVLALALTVADADGLDEDELDGVRALISAFGVDEERVHELAGR